MGETLTVNDVERAGALATVVTAAAAVTGTEGGGLPVLGCPTLDRDHERLVDLTRVLSRAINERQPRESIEGLFWLIHEHCRAHFLREEALMSESRFQDLAAHARSHRVLMTELAAMYDHVVGATGLRAQDSIDRLLTWILEHVHGWDRRLALHLQSLESPKGADRTGGGSEPASVADA